MSGIAIKIQGADYSERGLGKVHIKGSVVPVTEITINGADTITDSGQFTAVLMPENTTQTSVVWSITSGGSFATIDQNGLVTALPGADNSSVTIKCTSEDKPSVYGSKTIGVTFSTKLVTDGLIRNFDAYGTDSASLKDQVGNQIFATFNGAAGENCIDITSTLDGNTHSGALWEGMLNGLSTWTLEYVIEAKGFSEQANAVADIYHDVSTEVSGRVTVYLGRYSSSYSNGMVQVRASSKWQSGLFDTDTTDIDWNVPHVIHVTRESMSSGWLFKLYVDGVYKAFASNDSGYSGPTSAIDVVYLASKGSRKLYALRAYNRALTAAEVEQNNSYNVERYSLSQS